MHIEVGIQKSRIVTDNRDIIRELAKLYAFRVPGAEYTAAYQKRRWDGKKKFLSLHGVFRTGLLERILTDLESIGCVPELRLSYEPLKTLELKKIDGFTYYDYQEEFIKAALEGKRGVVKSPTGSGKTLIMAGLVKSLMEDHPRILILCHQKQIVKQNYDFLLECGIDNVGICTGEGFVYGEIMVATYQSFDKLLDTHLDDLDVLIVDEVHEFCSGDTTLTFLESFCNTQYRIGLTATVPSKKIPSFNLEGAFGPSWTCKTTQELIEEGKLSRPTIQIIPVGDPDYDPEEDEDTRTYDEVYNDFIVNGEERSQALDSIIGHILKTRQDAKILILAKSLEHMVKLQADYPSCICLEGKDSLVDRYKGIDEFINSKGNRILVGTKILQTGININEITHFINVRGLKSDMATIQALGRSLRLDGKTNRVYVYDFLDRCKYLYTHSNSRIRTYKKEGHEVEIL